MSPLFYGTLKRIHFYKGLKTFFSNYENWQNVINIKIASIPQNGRLFNRNRQTDQGNTEEQ